MSAKSLKNKHRKRYTKMAEINGVTMKVRKRGYQSLKEFARGTPEGQAWLRRKKQ